MNFDITINNDELPKILKLFNTKFDCIYHKVSSEEDKTRINVTTENEDYDIMEVLMEEFESIKIEHTISVTDINNKVISSIIILTNGKCEIRDSNNEVLMEYHDCNWSDIFRDVLVSSDNNTKFTDLRK